MYHPILLEKKYPNEFIYLFVCFSVGGSIPIVFAYFGEFCPLDGRGKKLGFLLMFWVLGGIYVSGLAWLIIPETGIMLFYSMKIA